MINHYQPLSILLNQSLTNDLPSKIKPAPYLDEPWHAPSTAASTHPREIQWIIPGYLIGGQ